MPRIVIIGAGVVGASVAYRLSQTGATVTVLEAARPAAGTSSNSFAWANANDKPPAAYFTLNFLGLREHYRLAEELGGEWFHPTGNLEVTTDPEQRLYLRQKVAALRAQGYQSELISVDRARELAPDLALPDPGTADYAFFAEEAWIAAPVLIHDLLTAAARQGARLVYPARVQALDVQDGRVVGVMTAEDRYPADLVVDCGGPAAGEVLGALGLTVARRRSPGFLIVTEPVPTGLRPVVHADGVHLRPDGAGRLRIGMAAVDDALPLDWEVADETIRAQSILRRAAAIVPALAGASVEGIRRGWRPMPADGYSAVGPVAAVPGYYLVFTHSGVTLGPLLGRLVAEELTRNQPRAELATFRPERLVTRAD